MLGLQESDQWQMIENMIDNFSYLIQTFNHIPNGNRSYYLTRSQPPFFSLMVELLAEHKGDKVYTAYLPSLQKEYNYWMDQSGATQHVVQMPDKSILNRYYDAGDYPRKEGFVHDENLAKQVVGEKVEPQLTEEYKRVCRDLRSGAESGWDFSTRWFADGMNISTIQTTSILPVDLNALLYHLETTLAKAYKLNNQKELSHIYSQKAEARCKAMNKYFWSNSKGWFVDYNIVAQQQVNQLNAAGITPLFFKMASKRQAARVDKTARLKFLRNGGFATTLVTSGQQWDAPNGWAPLQWMAVKGLINYNKGETAKEIASRWIALNVKVYEKTGKLMEKYNIEDIDLEAGGGEYAGQDGFGWTNGVLLKLISIYGEPVK
jgi:alpha,alpha-trehalase